MVLEVVDLQESREFIAMKTSTGTFIADGFFHHNCDPQNNVVMGRDGKNRQYGVNYNGSSNIDELRESISSIFLQRKAEDYLLELPGRQLNWIPVEVDINEYKRVMKDYEARREAGELSSKGDHLSLLNEARVSVALSKVASTIEVAETWLEAGHKVIIGSVYTKVTDKLIEYFSSKQATAKWGANSSVVFVGNKSAKDKQEAVDSFQDDSSKRIFIGTYTNGQSAATGLTLTAASVVLVNDFDWVPANIKQFYKRADRIGQTKFVNVIFMLAAGTFDEEMATMLEEKLEVVNEFEGVTGSLFEDLVARLATAPKNEEAKAISEARSISAARSKAAAA